MINYKNLLTDIPSVYYVDIKSPKQALFQLLGSGDHIVSYTQSIIKLPSVIDSYTSGEDIYYIYPINGHSVIDVITEIKSNADEILIKYSPNCVSHNDTILTCTLFTEQPCIILVYKKDNIPEHILITMVCSLLPVKIYNKILNNKVCTNTCIYENGTISLLE
jgi:hypothetical protein